MNICKKIIEQTEELFECSRFKEYIRIETPFIYPDGDVIDIFYKENSVYKEITDLGGLSNWLSLQIISDDRTEKQKEQIEYICQTFRVESKDGELFIDLGKGNEIRNLAEAIFDLGQAMIRIASLWFLQTNRAKNNIINSIENFMEVNEINYEKNKPFTGNSGDIWKPNFYTESNQNQKFLIYVLSGEKQDSASSIIYRINTAWDDLHYLKDTENSEYEFISLFDDRYDIWKSFHRKILKRNSIIKQFSNRNDLRNTLIGIAK